MPIKFHVNQATRFRRTVMQKIAEAYYAGMDAEILDRLPFEILPKDDAEHPFRCCVYRDRAVLKHRCIAALGANVEAIEDEFLPISHYAREAMERNKIEGPILTVLDIACESCIRAQYTISNLCRGCIARPCTINCPVECISIENHQARIDPERCINCGKCQQVCPYHAVVRVPVPCEEACPVGAISRAENGKQRIDWEKCTSCGRCMRACPFGAIMERQQILDVLRAIDSSREVIAMCAPAITGQFTASISSMAAGLKQLGFDRVVEVALGADDTCQFEAKEFQERIIEKGERFMTTSCCPAYIEAAHKHMPELMPHISETPTPMHYVAARMRRDHPEAVTVFIGPCVAKRTEGMKDDCVDYVLTFEEIGAMLAAKKIEPAELEEVELEGQASAEGRGFPLTGGVAAAVKAVCKEPDKVNPIKVDGLSKEGLNMLRAYAKGQCPGNLVEVMTCEGGCINGAGVYAVPSKTCKIVKEFADNSKHLK